MPTELLVFLVGIVCAILGAIGHWWCCALPRYQEYRLVIAAEHRATCDVETALTDALFDRDHARDQYAEASLRADAAEALLGQKLMVEAGATPLEAARASRGRTS